MELTKIKPALDVSKYKKMKLYTFSQEKWNTVYYKIKSVEIELYIHNLILDKVDIDY